MKLKTSIAIVGIALCGSSTLHAQKVGIRTNDPKAIVEVSSTISGVLMPRMDSITRVALNVGADQNGMQVYDTDSKSFWYYDHSIPKWLEIKDISSKFVDGMPTSTAVYTAGNVGIGTGSPTEKVHVVGNMFSEDTLAGRAILISDPATIPTLATGGTVTTVGDYTIHSFTSVGSSTFTPNGITDIEYLVVGGGGGGPWGTKGGGGGAGDFVPGTHTLTSNSPITITVGNGGWTGDNGAPSSIAGIATAIGGGSGGGGGSFAAASGTDGASGGGRGRYLVNGAFASGNAGTGTGINGNDGGPAQAWAVPTGGGGAGGPGMSAGWGGSIGGPGLPSDITGTTQWYAGGGGGQESGGGIGGGGSFSAWGVSNTGGGGGGGHSGSLATPGGSGIVVIRYLTPDIPEIIASNGKYVGIGTPNPTAILSVNGDANKPGGGSWAVYSDERSKENITDYTKGAEELLELQPVSFQYKETMNWGTDTYVGLIAQEVEKAVPSMVTTKKVNNINDFKEVDPNELNYMLINAVKELQEKQTALKQALADTSQLIDIQLEQLKLKNNEIKYITNQTSLMEITMNTENRNKEKNRKIN